MYSLLGVILALFSCICESVGLCVWRLASMSYYGAPDNAIRARLLGFFFQALSMLFNVAALSLMAESSATIVNSFSVISIIAVSWIILGEKPHIFSVIGAFVVFLGMVLCVISKTGNARILEFDESMFYLSRVQDIVWLSCLFSFAIFFFYLASACNKQLLYAFGAGFMGGLTETLAKIMATSIGHVTELFVLLAVLAVSVSFELYMIQTSLVYLKPHVHTLVFFVSWSLVGILSGGIMFDEFATYANQPFQIATLVIGILSIVAGVCIPTLFGPPRRNTNILRSSRHKAVPQIITRLIRPPFKNVRQYQRPEYAYYSDDEEIGGYDNFRNGGVIEMQRLTEVTPGDGSLDQSTGDTDGTNSPEEEPTAVSSYNFNEQQENPRNGHHRNNDVS